MDLQWLQSDEAKKISEAAKAKAWKYFKKQHPNADLNKFVAQTDFIDKIKICATLPVGRR